MRIRLLCTWASARKFVYCCVAGCTIGSLLSLAASCAPTPVVTTVAAPSNAQPVVQAPPSVSNTAAPAQPAPVYECRWTDQPITIDGKADEPAWKNAPWIDHFTIPWKQGEASKPIEATRAKVLWDREYFYYFADMDDNDVYADVKEHNGTIWLNDCFEVFFKPDEQKGGYYEFEVNPLNTRMEVFMPARNAGGWPRFKNETKIQHDTAIVVNGTLNNWRDKDKGWCVEGRIRWRDFAYTHGRPNNGESWKFALCRVNIGMGIDKQELTSCAPFSLPDFHHYEDYATLKFVRSDAGGPATAPAAANERPYGISTPVAWTTSNVIGYPDPPMPFTVAPAFPNLHVRQSLKVLEEPGTDNYFLLQHLGFWSGPSQLSRFKNDPKVDSAEVLLHLDHLVYGFTLHPDFLHNGYLYLIANGPVKAENKQNRLMRFTVDRKTGKIDPTSQLIYLEWDSNGHNGGDLAFGPHDGYLYYAAGDTTSDSDVKLRGQDTHYLSSKMIRIDVDHPEGGKPYSVPKDNPWIDKPDFQPEAWAMGFRNPWRLAFDRKTGDLWVGQNGQDLWEQVYLVHKGENYGWSRFEGSHPFQPLRKGPDIPITNPIAEHPHSEMRSLTGGIVYRGTKYPELDGAFLYGDWSTGRIWGVKSDDHKTATWHKELARTTLQIGGFHETADGDILVIDQGGTILQKLVPNLQQVSAKPFPRQLSETGLFVSTKDNQPQAALIPYDVNAPLWSDGALKQRFIAIPAAGAINMTDRGWDFPEGTVLVKTFSLEMEQGNPASAKRIETRLITKQQGQWAGYTYLWNDEQTDATLAVAAGVDKTYSITDAAAPGGKREQTWHFPSRAECMTCHSRASHFVLGVSTLQLNRDFVYPNGVKDNQLRSLEHLGLLRVNYMGGVADKTHAEFVEQGKTDREAWNMTWNALATRDQREPAPGSNTMLPLDPEHMDHLVNPYDETADLNLRARSYLHANCAICHVEAGGGNGLMILEYGVPPAKCNLVDAAPQHDKFGIEAARIIAAGHSDSSTLLHRVSTRGPGQMPPLASSRVDVPAVKMLREWIDKMQPLPPEPPETK